LVVKSNTITITVTQAAAPAPPTPTAPKVSGVSLSADRYSVNVGDTVAVTASVTLVTNVPVGYEAVTNLTLYGRDPNGVTKTLGTGDVRIPAYGYSGTYKWNLTFQTPGTWTLWAEAPDQVTLVSPTAGSPL